MACAYSCGYSALIQHRRIATRQKSALCCNEHQTLVAIQPLSSIGGLRQHDEVSQGNTLAIPIQPLSSIGGLRRCSAVEQAAKNAAIQPLSSIGGLRRLRANLQAEVIELFSPYPA